MKLEQLLTRINYTVLSGNTDADITDVIYDSRKVIKGCAFVCLVGSAADGHKFAADAVKKLEEALPGCVYPQFVRMNANEPELENFFRYWKEKSNASNGNFIIQKFNC